ncbi:MAG: PAS domain S-box protein [Alphaproteobacteria bacterium]|nr:PAS domain S-box protein [Alphaproteobacteria bacterium]
MSTNSSTREANEADLPFRQVAQDLPTPCWISDEEGSIIWVNAAWLAYTGLDAAAIRESGLAQLHDPAIYPKVQQRWGEVKAARQPAEMVFPLKGRDGLLRPFLTRVVPLRDVNGIVTRWFGTNTDVSEQSKIEAELRESQQRLELATEAAELGIWDWNVLDGTFIYSPRARTICGFPPAGPLTYEDVVRVTHPDDYPNTSAMAQRALDPAIKSVERYRYRIVRPDGVVRIVEAHGRAVFETSLDGEERATRYVGTLLDVTEVTELQQASRETEAILNSLFDASELYIAVLEVTEDSFHYILANRATTEFYDLPPGAADFDACDTGMSPAERTQWRDTLLAIWESGAPRTMEYAFDGGKGAGWYIGTYTPLPPGPQNRPRISFVVIDVSERKRAEERQTLLMREVDHRAKNALAVAQAIVQLTQAETVDAFRQAAKGRMATLARVHTLLAEERWAGADLGRLVREELEPYAVDRPSRTRVEGPAFALSPAVAQTIGLVLHELATNAAKHGALSHFEGEVHVAWRVSDTGDLEIVWREKSPVPPFQHGRRGFGFTMLEQSIEKQLGGRWRIDSTNEGFVCMITLPQGDTASNQVQDPAAASPTLQVLLVEDEPLIALGLEQELAELGISVTSVAGRLAEAEYLSSGRRYDLAVLDLNLAGASTVDLARRLCDAGTRVIFCTGYQAANLPPDLSVVPVLTKPVQERDLREALWKLQITTA